MVFFFSEVVCRCHLIRINTTANLALCAVLASSLTAVAGFSDFLRTVQSAATFSVMLLGVRVKFPFIYLYMLYNVIASIARTSAIRICAFLMAVNMSTVICTYLLMIQNTVNGYLHQVAVAMLIVGGDFYCFIIILNCSVCTVLAATYLTFLICVCTGSCTVCRHFGNKVAEGMILKSHIFFLFLGASSTGVGLCTICGAGGIGVDNTLIPVVGC